MTKHLLTFVFILTGLFQACQAQEQRVNLDSSNYYLYSNELYGFEVPVPDNWIVYGEVRHDSIKQFSIIDWGLPKVYSEIKKRKIEHSISIRAFRNSSISSLNELINSEYIRNNPVTTALEIEPENAVNSRIIYHSNNGLEYKGKCYYRFNNGVCYVILYMATPSTFDKNILIFERFYEELSISN